MSRNKTKRRKQVASKSEQHEGQLSFSKLLLGTIIFLLLLLKKNICSKLLKFCLFLKTSDSSQKSFKTYKVYIYWKKREKK